MTTHELKCWTAPFEAIADGRKTFEFRRNDRGFLAGDKLRLREFSPVSEYSGREIDADVTYVLCGPGFGVPHGFCVMSLRVQPWSESPCSQYKHGEPAGDCDGDGHYLCRRCVFRSTYESAP